MPSDLPISSVVVYTPRPKGNRQASTATAGAFQLRRFAVANGQRTAVASTSSSALLIAPHMVRPTEVRLRLSRSARGAGDAVTGPKGAVRSTKALDFVQFGGSDLGGPGKSDK